MPEPALALSSASRAGQAGGEEAVLPPRPRAVTHELYPFTSQIHDLNGLKLHYLDEGPREAPVLVMVHGNPTWSFYYRHLIQYFSKDFRCLALDHIGCGLSDKPRDAEYPYRLERRVEDLDHWLQAVAPEGPVTLVLHDWGGMIGMSWADRNPERIARLALFNTAAFHLPKSKPFPWPLWLTRTPLGALLVRSCNMFAWTASRVCCKKVRLSGAERAAYLAPYNSWRNRLATLRFVQDIPLRPRDPGYDLITEVQSNLSQFKDTPTFIGWGLRDFVFDKHFLEDWTRYLPEAEVHRYEDGGHYILEDYAEELAAKLCDFLRRHPIKAGQA